MKTVSNEQIFAEMRKKRARCRRFIFFFFFLWAYLIPMENGFNASRNNVKNSVEKKPKLGAYYFFPLLAQLLVWRRGYILTLRDMGTVNVLRGTWITSNQWDASFQLCILNIFRLIIFYSLRCHLVFVWL